MIAEINIFINNGTKMFTVIRGNASPPKKASLGPVWYDAALFPMPKYIDAVRWCRKRDAAERLIGVCDVRQMCSGDGCLPRLAVDKVCLFMWTANLWYMSEGYDSDKII